MAIGLIEAFRTDLVRMGVPPHTVRRLFGGGRGTTNINNVKRVVRKLRGFFRLIGVKFADRTRYTIAGLCRVIQDVIASGGVPPATPPRYAEIGAQAGPPLPPLFDPDEGVVLPAWRPPVAIPPWRRLRRPGGPRYLPSSIRRFRARPVRRPRRPAPPATAPAPVQSPGQDDPAEEDPEPPVSPVSSPRRSPVVSPVRTMVPLIIPLGLTPPGPGSVAIIPFVGPVVSIPSPPRSVPAVAGPSGTQTPRTRRGMPPSRVLEEESTSTTTPAASSPSPEESSGEEYVPHSSEEEGGDQ